MFRSSMHPVVFKGSPFIPRGFAGDGSLSPPGIRRRSSHLAPPRHVPTCPQYIPVNDPNGLGRFIFKHCVYAMFKFLHHIPVVLPHYLTFLDDLEDRRKALDHIFPEARCLAWRVRHEPYCIKKQRLGAGGSSQATHLWQRLGDWVTLAQHPFGNLVLQEAIRVRKTF